MKDKRIGKTVFPYVTVTASAWPHWKHPKGHLFNETQMDEMDAKDVEPPVVLPSFRLMWGGDIDGWSIVGWNIVGGPDDDLDRTAIYDISAQLIDGEAVLVAEKVQP